MITQGTARQEFASYAKNRLGSQLQSADQVSRKSYGLVALWVDGRRLTPTLQSQLLLSLSDVMAVGSVSNSVSKEAAVKHLQANRPVRTRKDRNCLSWEACARESGQIFQEASLSVE